IEETADIIRRQRHQIAAEPVRENSQAIAQVVLIYTAGPFQLFCLDHFASSFCDCLPFNVLPVMPRIKLRCIDEGNAIEVLSRFAVFQRGGVQRHPCFAKRFKSSAVNESVLTVKQRCVHVSAGQLCRLCFRLGLCSVEISKVEPVTFAADVIGDAVVYSAWLLVSVNLHRGGTTFYDDRESVSLRVHTTI